VVNVVVAGSQWGDERKGRIVDWLPERADMVVLSFRPESPVKNPEMCAEGTSRTEAPREPMRDSRRTIAN